MPSLHKLARLGGHIVWFLLHAGAAVAEGNQNAGMLNEGYSIAATLSCCWSDVWRFATDLGSESHCMSSPVLMRQISA